MDNPTDKTLGEGTGVYSFGSDSTGKVSISDSVAPNYGNDFHTEIEMIRSGLGFSDPRIDSLKGFETVELNAEEKGVVDTRLVVLNRLARNEKEVDVSQQKEFDLDANREVSDNGISLFVEVFGPSNCFTKGDEQVLGGNLENGRRFDYDKMEVPSLEVPQKEGDAALSDEDKFLVGDLVWVLTKTKSWWPGQIIDPSNVSLVSPKPNQKVSLLVKYFGNNPSVWCSPKQLKHFVENFEHMSLQGKSRVFLSAVEKAVDEFGRHIKAQMACSCENRAIKEENVFLDKNVLTQFEPWNFLHLVKNLAWGDSKPGVLELAKVQSHLSAFYRSLGHQQLPMNQLHDSTDDDKHSAKRGNNLRLKDVIGNKDSEVMNRDKYPLQFSEVKSKKMFESRERKRSKYLSYPYIDLNQPCMNLPVLEEDATNEVAVSNSLEGLASVSSPMFKSTGRKLYTRRPQKPTYQPKAPITRADLDTPLVDLLSKLRFAALDYAAPSEERYFDSVDRFFYGFRRWVFHDKYDPEMEHKHGIGKKSKEELKSKNSMGDKSLTRGSNKVTNLKRKRREREISTISNGQAAPTSGVFDENGMSSSYVLNFEIPGSFGPHNISEPKRRKKRAKKFLELVQGEIEVGLPDLNGNCAMQGPFIENSPANITTVNKRLPSKSNKKVGPLSWHSDAEIELPDEQLNNDWNELKGSLLVKESWVMGLSVPGNNTLEAEKRNRKEKKVKTGGLSATIPDLNGNANVAETSSLAKMLPEKNIAPNESKPLKKRSRRNTISGLQADLDPCFSKVFTNGESLGTALVMTFAQGFPVPSKEALIATFCGFGPLNESETRGLSDDRSAQVVFRKGSDAVEALKGIEKSSPFGPVLIKCQLHHLSPVPEPSGLKPCELKAVSSPKEAPDLAYIRKNLEMMTLMLEKGGDNLSADMRAKLENEIKGLLKKVSTMVGSTSSS